MDARTILDEIKRKAEEIYKEAASKGERDRQVIEAILKTDTLLGEGKYLAISKRAIYLKNLNTRYGLANAIDIEFEVIVDSKYGSIKSRIIKERYFQSLNPGSHFVLQLTEILEKDPRKGFNIDELLGKILEIDLVHNASSDGEKVYVNIDSLRKVVDEVKEVI